MFARSRNPVKIRAKLAASCIRSPLGFLPEAERKVGHIRPRWAAFAKLQKADLDRTLSPGHLNALVGRRCRFGLARRHNTASRGRYFLAKVRGIKQLKSLASGPRPEVDRNILFFCSRYLTVCKRLGSRARRLLGIAFGVFARLFPDRADFLMQDRRFQE